MKRILLVGIVMIAGSLGAFAAEPRTMPIDFVGDWCFESREKNATDYALPSWTEDGQCTKGKIISVTKGGFYLWEENINCEPVRMRLSRDVAPSGVAYMATITARCYPDGPVTAGTLKTFEFSRYKGHLTITAK
jgi:hypothetical protein